MAVTDNRWTGLATVGKIEAVREINGRASTETRRTRLMSRKMSPEKFLKTVRNRWATENNLHWVLDVQKGEDNLRNWANNGPKNLATLRRIAPDIVKLMDDRLSIVPTTARAGGASARLSPRTHKKRDETRQGILKCNRFVCSARRVEDTWMTSNLILCLGRDRTAVPSSLTARSTVASSESALGASGSDPHNRRYRQCV